MNLLPSGLYTALITPFSEGKIDYASLEKLLEFQINANVSAVVLCGTTGESATLSFEEKCEIIEFAVKFCKGKIKIIAGTGSNNTAYSATLTRQISKYNPDGFLVVSPYYNKATNEGLSLHFKEICKTTNLPIILYNVPARTGLNMSDEIISRIAAENSNVIGIKDATGDLSRVVSLREKVATNFMLFSGEDATALAFNASGGNGVISVVSNIAPRIANKLQQSTNAEEAQQLQQIIFKISKVLFAEVNPVPVKFAAFLLGLCKPEYRLPLCVPCESTQKLIKEILELC